MNYCVKRILFSNYNFFEQQGQPFLLDVRLGNRKRLFDVIEGVQLSKNTCRLDSEKTSTSEQDQYSKVFFESFFVFQLAANNFLDYT